MPLITPPSDNDYPVEEPVEQESLGLSDEENRRRIELFLNIVPWICPSCRLTNFGRNLLCAHYRCKQPRPADFVNRRKYD